MKRSLLRCTLLLSVLIMLLSRTVAAENLVVNPGFEESMSGWGVAFGGEGTANAIDTEHFRSGEKSFYAKSEGMALRVGAVQNIPVMAPGTYRVHAYFRGQDVQAAQPDHGVIIRVQFQDDQSRLVQSSKHIIGDISRQGEWMAIGDEVVVPPQTTRLRVEFFLWYATGEVWWDDITIERLDPQQDAMPSGENLITNGSFHDGLDHWEQWTPAGNPEITYDTEVYRSAPGAARLQGFDPADRAALVKRLPIEAGKFYTISAWVKTEDVTGNKAYLRVQFNHADNATQKTRSHLILGQLSGTRDWSLLQQTFQVPPETGSLIIEPFLDGAQGIVWWDDVQLVADQEPVLSVENAHAETLPSGAVRLTWSVPDAFAGSTFRIYRSVIPTFDVTTLAPIGTSDRGEFIDRNTSANRTYYYKILPIGPDGEPAEPSDPLQAVIGTVAESHHVTSFLAEWSLDGVRLSWSLDRDTRARQIRLERGIVNDEGVTEWRLVGLTPFWMTHHTDTTLPAGVPTNQVRYRASVISPEGEVSEGMEAPLQGVNIRRERAVPVGEHPSLFITEQEISELIAAAESNPALNALLQSDIIRPGRSVALTYLTRDVTLPPKGDNSAHSNLAASARRAALGYAFTKESMLGEAAKKILLAYAKEYKEYPLHLTYDGRVTTQTLNESPWLIDLVWAYDLILPSGLLSEDEKALIEEDLFWNAVHVIERYRRGRSNWQAWHNAAIGAVAIVLNDTEWIHTVIDGPQGFTHHIREGLLGDGLWWEQAIGYHDYTRAALVFLAEAAWRNGFDLYSYESEGKSLKLAFDAPLYHAFTDGLHPVIGNTSPNSTLRFDWTYGLGLLRYGDPRYAWLWYQSAAAGTGAIPSVFYMPALQSMEAPEELVLGMGSFAPAGTNLAGSTHFADTGMTVMRTASIAENGLELAMVYKPHGTWIGHQGPDNLTILLEGPGGRWLPGPGSYNYDASEQGTWYKQTVARNGVVLDETSQSPQGTSVAIFATDSGASSGQLLHFVALPGLGLTTAATDRVYPDARLERTVLVSDSYVIDRYLVSSPRERQIDWVVNVAAAEGAISVEQTPQVGALGKQAGYQHIRNVRIGTTDATWQASWTKADGTALNLTMLGGETTEVIRATGLGPSLSGQPILLARRHAAETEFVSVLEVVGAEDVTVGVREYVADGLRGVKVTRSLGEGTEVDRMVWPDERAEHADHEYTLPSGERFRGGSAYFRGADGVYNGALMLLDGTLIATPALSVEAETPTDVAAQWTDTSLTVAQFGSGPVELTVRLEGTKATVRVYQLVPEGELLEGVGVVAMDGVTASDGGVTWTAQPEAFYVVAEGTLDEDALQRFVIQVR